jgi:hypothetical protein
MSVGPRCFCQRVWSFASAFVFLAVFLVASTNARADQTVVVRSGNGPINSQDTQVRYFSYGTTGDITPTPANFVSAQTGPFAYVVAPYATYLAALPHPAAKRVARTVGWPAGTTLYAIPFQLTNATINSATLNFYFSVDNAVNGVFLMVSVSAGTPTMATTTLSMPLSEATSLHY